MGNHKRFLFYFHLDFSSCQFLFSFFLWTSLQLGANGKEKNTNIKNCKYRKRKETHMFACLLLFWAPDSKWSFMGHKSMSCYKADRWFPASSMLNGPNILNGILNDLLLWFIIWSLTCLTHVFFNFSPFVWPFPNRRADSQSNLVPFDIII